MHGTKIENQPVKPRHIGMIIAAAAVLVIAADLRFCGAQNGLWLDEIWSLGLTGRVSSPMDVFFKIHHDNNHYLNTLFMYLLGHRGDWPGYRIPSVLAGIGTVALAGLIGREREAVSGLMAMILVGFSYVLILYSSEARGYSTLVFFSFLCYYLIGRYLKDRRWPLALSFSLAASLGFMSQLLFASFLLSVFLWTAWRLIRELVGFKQTVFSLAQCYGLPALVVIALYFGDIQYIHSGGGTKQGLWQCYEAAAAWVLGTPPMTLTGFILMVVFFALSVRMLWREDPDSIVFYGGSIVAVPLLLASFSEFEFLYVRHFIVPIAFSLVLLSFLLASLYRSAGYAGKVIACLLVSGYVAINGWHVVELFQNGRGDDRAALRYMIENTKSPVMTVGGDSDVRIGMVLNFYVTNGMESQPVRYFPNGSWPMDGVEWFVADKESTEAPIAPPDLYLSGHTYELVRTFPTAPLSGLHWFVYHRVT